MKKLNLAALACLSASLMLLPVIKTVNNRSVNTKNANRFSADGIGAPTPPFPVAASGTKTLADGIGAPTPPFPVNSDTNGFFADGIGAPTPPFPVV